jgi:hypothetical protein
MSLSTIGSYRHCTRSGERLSDSRWKFSTDTSSEELLLSIALGYPRMVK